MIKKSDIVAILLTFIIGVAAGGYLYVVGFAPQFDRFTGETAEVYDDLVIVGEQYGGFRTANPPSFQVRGDGTFRYIGMTETGAPLTREGTLSRAFLTELGGELTSTQLYTQSRVIEPASCDSYVDGIDYKYEITLNTVIFTLDTCGTDFTLESSTGQTLDKLWKYFASLS